MLIAEELGEDEIAAARRAELAAHLEAWLEGSNADALRTDATWGGVVPSRGVVDPGADYGAGFYNDHHFHYGYFVYAAAVLAKGDAAWAARWAPAVTHLIRDIANPSDADELYPPMRHKDWFVGHSWAGGLFPSASGRNQESTSEAVNAWYAIALFGEAIGDGRLALLGRTLLATEVRAAQTYWQVKDGSEIYPQPFAAHHLACIVWSTKVDYATWFGSNVEYLFGIQMMPVTPVSELLLDAEWLRQSLPAWEAAMRGRAVPEWRGILIMGFALLDPAAAWRAALELTRWDNGNTRTNELWWIATRAPPCCGEGRAARRVRGAPTTSPPRDGRRGWWVAAVAAPTERWRRRRPAGRSPSWAGRRTCTGRCGGRRWSCGGGYVYTCFDSRFHGAIRLILRGRLACRSTQVLDVSAVRREVRASSLFFFCALRLRYVSSSVAAVSSRLVAVALRVDAPPAAPRVSPTCQWTSSRTCCTSSSLRSTSTMLPECAACSAVRRGSRSRRGRTPARL